MISLLCLAGTGFVGSAGLWHSADAPTAPRLAAAAYETPAGPNACASAVWASIRPESFCTASWRTFRASAVEFARLRISTVLQTRSSALQTNFEASSQAR